MNKVGAERDNSKGVEIWGEILSGCGSGVTCPSYKQRGTSGSGVTCPMLRLRALVVITSHRIVTFLVSVV